MGILDRLFRKGRARPAIPKSGPSRPAEIRTLADVRAFFLAVTGDEELSKLLTEVASRTSVYGYLSIQQGGTGTPYAIEFMPNPEEDPRLPTGENKLWEAAYHSLQQQLDSTTPAPERDELERKLAILTYCLCTLYINTSSTVEFSRRSDMIRRAWKEFTSTRIAGR